MYALFLIIDTFLLQIFEYIAICLKSYLQESKFEAQNSIPLGK